MIGTSTTEPSADRPDTMPALCAWTEDGPNESWRLRLILPDSRIPAEASPAAGQDIFADLNGLTDRRNVPGGVMARHAEAADGVATAVHSIELAVPRGYRGALQFLPVPRGLRVADRPTWLGALERAFLPTGRHGLREARDMRGQSVLEVAAPDARPLLWSGEGSPEPRAHRDAVVGAHANDEQVITLDSTPRRIRIHRPERAPASAPVLVVFDGMEFVRGGLLTAIDELVSPPSTVIAVDHEPVGPDGDATSDQRADDLVMNPRFCDDVLALVRRISPDVADRMIVAGASYGGLAAAYFSLRHPEWFRGICLSPSFWQSDDQGRRIWDFVPSGSDHRGNAAGADPESARRAAESAADPVAGPVAESAAVRPTFCVDHGILETAIAESVAEATDEFAMRGLAIASRPFVGGHEYLWWRELMLVRLAEILAEPSAPSERLPAEGASR